jgi:hypothetical protein
LGGVIWSSMSPNNRLPATSTLFFGTLSRGGSHRQSEAPATWGRGGNASMLGVGGTSRRWWRHKDFEESGGGEVASRRRRGLWWVEGRWSMGGAWWWCETGQGGGGKGDIKNG